MNLNWHQFAHAASDAAGIPWRPVARCALLCAVLVLAGGCSWVPFWPGGAPDPGVDRHVDPGEMSSALSATSAEMASAPLEPYWPYRMGELYAAVDSTTEAVAHLRAALELDTGYSPAAALLSKLYYQMGNHTDAVQLLEGFIAENDAAPDALRAALALHLEALGEVERAQAVLDGCSGDSRAVREARTFVTLRGDDMAAALESATRSLEENPNSAANHNNYGIALLYAGRPVEAREAFLTALELDERLPGALYNMAIVEAFYFFDQDKGRSWFARYRKVAREDPDDLEAVFGTDLTRLSGDGDKK